MKTAIADSGIRIKIEAPKKRYSDFIKPLAGSMVKKSIAVLKATDIAETRKKKI